MASPDGSATLVGELELPAFDYTDADLHGPRFHQTMRDLRARGWLAATPLGYVVLEREAAGYFLRSRAAEFPGMKIAEIFGISDGPLYEEMRRNILHVNGADHARLRGLVNPSFTPRAAERWRPAMRGFMSELLDGVLHASADAMPFRENVVRQLHQTIYRFAPTRHAGRYKSAANDVTETHADGTVAIRFKPVAPALTAAAMYELHERFDELHRQERHHALLLLGAYVFDLLAIHPFQDGSGRTARLVTLLLLYQSGHDVGRYISLERLINESRDGYYGALQRSTVGWHRGRHTIWPWMEYLLGTFAAAYGELGERLSMVAGHGSKQPMIRELIRSRAVAEFTLDDLRSATPASDPLIKKVLGELRAAGAIELVQRGRYARYRRVHTDF